MNDKEMREIWLRLFIANLKATSPHDPNFLTAVADQTDLAYIKALARIRPVTRHRLINPTVISAFLGVIAGSALGLMGFRLTDVIARLLHLW